MSTTVASNYTGPVTQVRSGGLSFPAGSFSAGSSGTTPEAFGPTVNFNTPYLYTGGNLTVELRYSNFTPTTPSASFDATLTSTAGYGTDFAARWTSSPTATVTGSTGNFVITNFTSFAVPEPTGACLAGVAAIGLFVRRKR